MRPAFAERPGLAIEALLNHTYTDTPENIHQRPNSDSTSIQYGLYAG